MKLLCIVYNHTPQKNTPAIYQYEQNVPELLLRF